jgi:hypothetical protein
MDDDVPDDYFWDDLLECIEEGKVVPIIGSDLMTVSQPSGEVPLYRHVAGLLAQRLKVRIDDLGDDYTLNHVVCRFLDIAGDGIRLRIGISNGLSVPACLRTGHSRDWPCVEPDPSAGAARARPLRPPGDPISAPRGRSG